MWTYNYTPNPNDIIHYGIPGMRWGHRKAISTSGLTSKQIKKYAKKGYAKDNFKANKSVGGKAYDLFTGAHKISADIQYSSSSNKQNKARAEKYLKDKNKSHSKTKKSNAKRAIAKGATTVAKITSAIGTARLTDEIFYNGAGTRAVKSIAKQAGRAAYSAAAKAKGATNVRWYD